MIASALNLSRAEVYGTITFYHDFHSEPVVRHVLKLCRAEACQAMGARALETHAQRKLGIGFHETTADGVFTADISHEEFAAGVDAIMRGHYVMSATLANRTLERRSQPFEGSPASSAYRRLSATEREILLALGTAIPIESIAASRGITKKTVRNHVASIYHKLRLQSRAEAILWVARMGLSDDMHGDPAKVEAASA